MTAIQILIPTLGGLLAGLGALVGVLWLGPRDRRSGVAAGEPDILSEPRRLRFRNGYLVEHSDNVGFLLPAPVDRLRAWPALVEALSDVSPGIPAAFEALRGHGRPFKLSGPFGRDRIVVLGVRDGEDLRVTVSAAEERQTSVRVDLPSLEAMESEIAMLSRAGDTCPALGWAVDADGRVVWSNAAYLDLVARCEGPDAARGWPLRALFPIGKGQPSGRCRRAVRDRAGTEMWFEITVSAAESGLRHVHALSLDAVIRAEDSLRTFIQTLTKSFAYLPTGLAIFDRQGQLALFNPALIDMTGLDATWLSRRPRIADFFDALRDRRHLPEPRDYKAWRDGLAGIGREDGAGVYQESWSLPGGATYRVTARPQGDGAVTLMLEDITADLAATRRHREERDAMARLLDDLDDGIVVFDARGERILANGAATAIWRDDGGDLPVTLDACIAYWKAQTRPSGVWGELRDMRAAPRAMRAPWTGTLAREGRGTLEMSVTPLPGDRVALGFRDAERARGARRVAARAHAPGLTAAPARLRASSGAV